jgi:hypothetical protein
MNFPTAKCQLCRQQCRARSRRAGKGVRSWGSFVSRPRHGLASRAGLCCSCAFPALRRAHRSVEGISRRSRCAVAAASQCVPSFPSRRVLSPCSLFRLVQTCQTLGRHFRGHCVLLRFDGWDEGFDAVPPSWEEPGSIVARTCSLPLVTQAAPASFEVPTGAAAAASFWWRARYEKASCKPQRYYCWIDDPEMFTLNASIETTPIGWAVGFTSAGRVLGALAHPRPAVRHTCVAHVERSSAFPDPAHCVFELRKGGMVKTFIC